MTLPESFCEKLYESLVDSGVHEFRAAPVARFVTQCYDVLLSAHHDLVQPARWEQFCATRGATTTRRKAKPGPANISETAITADLSREAQRLLARGGPMTDLVRVARVVADLTSPSDTATGSSSKRPDLVFFPSDPTLDLEFAMEAKVIRLTASIAKELLGLDGFGCFIIAIDPYQTNGVVGLLGYVAPPDVAAMASEAQRCMQDDKRFSKASTHDLVVNEAGPNHRPRTVLGLINDAEPKVCLANMLAIQLTTP